MFGLFPLKIFVVLILFETVFGNNIFKDGDYEESNPHNNWICIDGCTMTLVTHDKVSGHNAVKITGRTRYYQGPRQNVNLIRNSRYHVVWYIKQLNSIPGKMFQEFRISGSFHVNSNYTSYPMFVNDERVHPGRGWVKLEGYIMTPDKAFTTGYMYIQMPDPGIEYLVDAATLTFIPEDKQWKENSNKRIDQLRKSNINFRLDVPQHTDPHDFEVEAKLIKHAFKFGSEVTRDMMIDSKHAHYRELFYYMFNYATMATYFWQWSSGPREHPDYSKSSQALDVLKKHGIPSRGHNIFWDKKKMTPDWVKNLTAHDVNREVEHRIHYIVNVTKGKLESWDVSNEILHGNYYETKMNDPYYCHHMYKLLHKLDPKVKLFLNDYGIAAGGYSASAYVDQAHEYRAAKVPLYALGIQSHFDHYNSPDPTIIWKRLDQIAATGFPLWITELDVVAVDENLRREWYDRLFRIYFSHPSVDAIIFWGFWGPKHWIGDQASLVSGTDYMINAAGQGYLDLIYKEWTTHVTRQLSSSGKHFTERGFHGDYETIVRYKGSPVHYQTFSLGKSDMTVHITVNNIHAHVPIPTIPSPLVYHMPTVHHKVIHVHDYSMTKSTSADSSTLTCINAWSDYSEVGDDKHVEVQCPQGYIMTGCSAMTKALTSKSDGASVQTEHGVACRAWDAGATTDYASPVHAIARCCKVTGLQCDYRITSKESPSQYDIIVETRCPNNMFVTGCTAHSYQRHIDGVYPTTHTCRTQTEDNFGGIYSYTICCHAPKMTCRVHKATFSSGHKIGDSSAARCDSGWAMTGCHGISEDGDMSGTFIEGDKCLAFNGDVKTPGMAGVVAYATCCKV